MIYTPKKEGFITLNDIDLNTVSRYINWIFFFSAWKIPGRFEGIEKVCLCASCETAWLQNFGAADRPKAKEALKLFRDAQQLLADIVQNKKLHAEATFCLIKAKSENEGIVFYPADNAELYIPMLRQQGKGKGGYCLSLADYVSPRNDYAGIFAVTVKGAEELRRKYEAENDTYTSLLIQSLADRLAEAATEWLHEQIRKEYWGYAPDENLTVEDLFKVKYQGIRPAVGYPSLPDQSVIFLLDSILDFAHIGIRITENGAMHPTSSTCGLMFAHPKAGYFMIGHIGEDQLTDYAHRKGVTFNEAKRWLGTYL